MHARAMQQCSIDRHMRQKSQEESPVVDFFTGRSVGLIARPCRVVHLDAEFLVVYESCCGQRFGRGLDFSKTLINKMKRVENIEFCSGCARYGNDLPFAQGISRFSGKAIKAKAECWPIRKIGVRTE